MDDNAVDFVNLSFRRAGLNCVEKMKIDFTKPFLASTELQEYENCITKILRACVVLSKEK